MVSRNKSVGEHTILKNPHSSCRALGDNIRDPVNFSITSAQDTGDTGWFARASRSLRNGLSCQNAL